MSLPEDEDCVRGLRTLCTNIIGFWQLLQCERAAERCGPVKRMEWQAYLTSGALEMAHLILEHHLVISEGFIEAPKRISEFTAAANRIRYLAVTLDGDCPDQLADEAFDFAVRFLAAMKEQP